MTEGISYIKFTKAEVEQSVPARFEEKAGKNPERVAVKSGNDVLTYEELNRAANEVAHAILGQRGEGEEAVAFLLEHGASQAVAMVGILKAGKAYLPLDPSFPRARLEQMLNDSQAGLIVTNTRNIALANELAHGKRYIINSDKLDSALPEGNPGLIISPERIANIYYTSGSTGEPKGVMQSHRNVLHFIMNPTNTWPISADDRIAHFVSCSFSAAAMTVFGALLNGAALMPFDLKSAGLGLLKTWLIEEKITICFAVPSVFRNFVGTLGKNDRFPDLRLIVLGGEVLYRSDVDLFRKHFSAGCGLINILASAEMLYIRHYLMDRDTEITDKVVPVGYAVEDKEVLLLDEEGKEAGFSEIGEIAVRSRYLSPGYWGRPELTESAFHSDSTDPEQRIYRSGDMGEMRPDGCLIYRGRKDSMVKIRGQRVEIGGIETALLEIDSIKEAAVVARDDDKGNKYLVAYIVAKSKPGPDSETVRALLGRKVPDYMVPLFCVVLDAFPLTPTGKVDRRALPEPEMSARTTGRDYVAPRDELERRLTAVCEDVLGIRPIGVSDNLFNLGLDSLRYLTLFLEIEKKLGRSIPSEMLPELPTVEHMASCFRMQSDLFQTGRVENTVRSYRRRSSKFHRTRARQRKNSERLRYNFSKKELFKICSRIVGKIVPYSLGMSLGNLLCGSQTTQKLFFKRHVELLCQFLPHIGIQVPDQYRISANLACNFLRYWRLSAFARMSANDLQKWLTVRGMTNFEQSYKSGKGVILINCHFSLGHSVLLFLERKGLEIATLQRDNDKLKMLNLEKSSKITLLKMGRTSNIELVSLLYDSKKVLDRGGIVHLAADGYRGTSGVLVPFLGSTRPFRGGFAELAVKTGAEIIPVFAIIDDHGRLIIEFFSPLDIGKPDMADREREEFLINQYAMLLEEKWRKYPHNITLGSIQKFLSFRPDSPQRNYGKRGKRRKALSEFPE